MFHQRFMKNHEISMKFQRKIISHSVRTHFIFGNDTKYFRKNTRNKSHCVLIVSQTIALHRKISTVPAPGFCPHFARRRTHLQSGNCHFLIIFGWTLKP